MCSLPSNSLLPAFHCVKTSSTIDLVIFVSVWYSCAILKVTHSLGRSLLAGLMTVYQTDFIGGQERLFQLLQEQSDVSM
ncbi:hypothetical protein H671_4g12553 [Cricetulus griseus]|nr:hypothetical protein H671_4g12553 [Cricetulus griseus]